MRNGKFGNGVFCDEFGARESCRDNADWLDELDRDDTDNHAGGNREADIERIGNHESVDERGRDRIGGDGENAEFFNTEAKNAKYDTGGNRQDLLPGWVVSHFWRNE